MLLRGLVRGLLRGLRSGLGVSFGSGRADVVLTNLDTDASTVDATSFLTASVSPSADAVQYLGVVSQIAGAPSAPTVTGCGLTWVLEESQALGATRGLFVYRAHGAPSAGQITIDYGIATQASIAWSVVEAAGADLSGTDGDAATLQSVPDTAAAATTIDSILAALENAKNAHLCFTALAVNTAITAGAGFSELGQDGAGSAALRLQAAWKVNDVICDPSFAASDVATVSIEVKSA